MLCSHPASAHSPGHLLTWTLAGKENTLQVLHIAVPSRGPIHAALVEERKTNIPQALQRAKLVQVALLEALPSHRVLFPNVHGCWHPRAVGEVLGALGTMGKSLLEVFLCGLDMGGGGVSSRRNLQWCFPRPQKGAASVGLSFGQSILCAQGAAGFSWEHSWGEDAAKRAALR